MNTEYVYEIESDIDFFKELKQISSSAMTSSSSSVTAIEETNETLKCLITDEKLRKDHITLQCGHKFNYLPLFKEVLFQKCSLLPKNLSSKLITTYTKTNMNHMGNSMTTASTTHSQTPLPPVLSVTYNSSYNLETTKLQYNQIKCPYCRSITSSILPYYPYPDVCKVKYVNTPTNLSLPSLSCEYEKFISGSHTSSGSSTIDESNICRSQCMYNEKYDLMLCNKHLNKLESRCSRSTGSPTQSRSTVTKKKRQQQQQQTILTDDAPETETETETENVIISHHNPVTSKCSFILLSGARKGTPCGKPMWISKTNTTHNIAHPPLCKVHYEKGIIA